MTDVKSVDNYRSKIEKLGRRVLHPKSPAPEMGWDALQFVFIQRITVLLFGNLMRMISEYSQNKCVCIIIDFQFAIINNCTYDTYFKSDKVISRQTR